MKPIPMPNTNNPRTKGKKWLGPSPPDNRNTDTINLGLTNEEISAIITNTESNPQILKERTAKIIQTHAMKGLGQSPQLPPTPEPVNMTHTHNQMDISDANPPHEPSQ